MTTERYDILIIGSGEAGKYLAWTSAQAGHKTALVERSLIGGSCPNIACLPSKNLIHSAKVAAFARRAEEFGLAGGPLTTDMNGVLRRKQEMVDGLLALHIERFHNSGTELNMGEAQFVGERTAEVKLNAGTTRVVSGENVILILERSGQIAAQETRISTNNFAVARAIPDVAAVMTAILPSNFPN